MVNITDIEGKHSIPTNDETSNIKPGRKSTMPDTDHAMRDIADEKHFAKAENNLNTQDDEIVALHQRIRDLEDLNSHLTEQKTVAEEETKAMKSQMAGFLLEVGVIRAKDAKNLEQDSTWMPMWFALAKGSVGKYPTLTNDSDSDIYITPRTSAHWNVDPTKHAIGNVGMSGLCFSLFASFSSANVGKHSLKLASNLWHHINERYTQSIPLDAIILVIESAISHFRKKGSTHRYHALLALEIWQIAKCLALLLDHVVHRREALLDLGDAVESMLADRIPFCSKLSKFIDGVGGTYFDYSGYDEAATNFGENEFIFGDWNMCKGNFAVIKGPSQGWLTILDGDSQWIDIVRHSNIKLVTTQTFYGGRVHERSRVHFTSTGRGESIHLALSDKDIGWWGFKQLERCEGAPSCTDEDSDD